MIVLKVPGGLNLCAAGQLRRLSSARAPRKDIKANIPKIKSAQAPTDMGDQYLNIGRKVFDSINICQKRSGLVRSIVKSNPLRITQGNAM